MHPGDYLVPFDGTFNIRNAVTVPPDNANTDKSLRKSLKRENSKLYELQRRLYAQNQYSILLIFQAMDAAGKDSTIRHVMRGVNPAGCQVFSFKQPSKEELDHDFLWRSAVRLPERGRIGIFNRSYYEETLVVRVHPEYLASQGLPGEVNMENIWEDRFKSIRDHEIHLAKNGIRIIKFWLNVSRDEQRNRFLERLDNPKKNWKFSKHDMQERTLWESYMNAYESTLNATSTSQAPWYAIPADNKPYARLAVARIIVDTLDRLDCKYPVVADKEKRDFDEFKRQLLADD
jgi:PPK2 family polyphosphate:nucleotide phosphotransferase